MSELNRISPCCDASRPYPIFNEQGGAILPCNKKRCERPEGTPIHPRTKTCLNPACNKEFLPLCPSMYFHSQECFEATGTEAAWIAATPPPPVTAKPAKVKKEKTLEQKAKKSLRNAAYYQETKGTSVYDDRYARVKARRAAERALKMKAESEGGPGRSHRFVRYKTGGNG